MQGTTATHADLLVPQLPALTAHCHDSHRYYISRSDNVIPVDGLNIWRFIDSTYRPQYVGFPMDGLTLICQHLHEERVLLPAIDDVRGIHPLRQTPRAALHPAWSQHGINSSACGGTQTGVPAQQGMPA